MKVKRVAPARNPEPGSIGHGWAPVQVWASLVPVRNLTPTSQGPDPNRSRYLLRPFPKQLTSPRICEGHGRSHISGNAKHRQTTAVLKEASVPAYALAEVGRRFGGAYSTRLQRWKML
jgi:hypothetical protein